MTLDKAIEIAMQIRAGKKPALWTDQTEAIDSLIGAAKIAERLLAQRESPSATIRELKDYVEVVIEKAGRNSTLTYQKPGMLTGADLENVLEECGVKTAYCQEEDCDCEERSWFGAEHDSACPLAGLPREEA